MRRIQPASEKAQFTIIKGTPVYLNTDEVKRAIRHMDHETFQWPEYIGGQLMMMGYQAAGMEFIRLNDVEQTTYLMMVLGEKNKD